MTSTAFTRAEMEAGRRLFAGEWRFVAAAGTPASLPPMRGVEIAFAGRSNVGKSSLLNALVRRHGLARTSNTPGRTQELNFFETPGVALYLVDMPGYGFAEAPKAKVEAWTALVKDYLRGRATLLRVMLLIDARHGLKPPDRAMMALMNEAAVSYQAILTKADKVKPHQLAATMAATQAALETHPAAFARLLATSAQTGTGIPELRAEMAGLAAAHGVLTA
jgi:GTP-binding protein